MKVIPSLLRRKSRPNRLTILLPALLMACQSLPVRPPSEIAPVAFATTSASATAPVQVDQVTLEVGTGSPIPVNLRIEGQLLDACAQLSDVHQQVDGLAITLTLNTAQTSPIECRNPAGSLPFVMSWPLNAVALVPGKYHITVNNTVAQFTWPAGATPPQPTEGNTNNNPAVSGMQYVLGQQLGLPESDIQLVNADPREWPDACLGAGYANELCAAAVTPGFQLIFNVKSQTYVVHTDLQAHRYRLTQSPSPQVGQTFISWTGPNDVEVGSCGQATIGTQGVAFGDCFGKLIGGRYINNARQNDVAEAATQFASFEIDTSAGQVKFAGTGTKTASPTQQRQIAEWARQLFHEARAGRTSAALGQVIQLDQTDAATQKCTTLAIHITGEVIRGNCDGSGEATSAELTEDQLAQLYKWVDTFGVFEQAEPDRLSFGGRGEQIPTEADVTAIKAFLTALY